MEQQEQKKSKLGMVIGIGVAAAIVIAFGMWWSATNSEAKARTQVEAQQEVCQVSFDAMWKILQEMAGVATEYRDAFSEVFPKIMEERYSGQRGGALLSFIKESNPNFDISLYAKVQNAISDERKEFLQQQKKLIDLHMQHKNLLRTKPTSFFFDLSDTLHITLVTSAVTKDAYVTGEENDVNLFKKQ